MAHADQCMATTVVSPDLRTVCIPKETVKFLDKRPRMREARSTLSSFMSRMTRIRRTIFGSRVILPSCAAVSGSATKVYMSSIGMMDKKSIRNHPVGEGRCVLSGKVLLVLVVVSG